ncbi:MAG TPA: transketolase C-terminal domain-containing protein [Burkholderiales bacterium]|nr:transketolase C-terminal domain-containing protein [Burkholderiales bacterium]
MQSILRPSFKGSAQPEALPAMKQLTYAQALQQGMSQAMELDERVFLAGQLVDYKSGVFGTTGGLVEKFGAARVRDFPVAESVMTSTAIGAALGGMRPVLVHHRLDFMLYSMDAIVNWLSLWRFKSNGKASLPITIRAIVGKGWGQGPQHSKSLHAWFAHVPGLQVAMPVTPFDAKGLLLESIFGENPTIIIEHRALFSMTEDVPEVPYRVRFGRARIRRPGRDVTLVAIGAMVPIALKVAEQLTARSIDVEVLDPRTISPLDTDAICQSVMKTGRLVVADPAWKSFSVAAEVITAVSEKMGDRLRANPLRITLPDSHTPMSAPLEKAYYPDETTVVNAVTSWFRR